MITNENRKLKKDIKNVNDDKATLSAWVSFKITTQEACKRFNESNGIKLTDLEFIEYAEMLGWRLEE